MADKSAQQTFTADWTKTVDWAKQNKIPEAAYYPVYQLDAKNLEQYGTGMSQAERTRAILSAANLSTNQSIPTDNPSPTNILGNAVKNLQSIFTGLEPTELATNVFDTLKNTVEHPSSVYGIVYKGGGPAVNTSWQAEVQNFRNHVLGKNDILSWVPGLYDIAQAMGGKNGAKQLADNPITSLLDVLPLGSAATRLLSATDSGARIAAAAGMTPEEMSGFASGKAALQPQQLAWRVMKNLDHNPITKKANPLGVVNDAGGNTVLRPMRNSERISAWRNTKSIGKDQGEIAKDTIVESEAATAETQKFAGPAVEALGKLNADEVKNVTKIAYTDFRDDSTILNDDKIPQNQRDALQKVFDWGHWNRNLKLQSGELVSIDTPYGKEVYLVKPGSNGAIVSRAKDIATKDGDALTKRAAPVDSMIRNIQQTDASLSMYMTRMKTLNGQMYDFVKAGLPNIQRPDIANVARDTLPNTQRWDRSVLPSQNVATALNLPKDTVDVISRNGKDAEVLSGKMSTWSPDERAAYESARMDLAREQGPETHLKSADIKARAKKLLQSLNKVRTVSQDASVTMRHAKAINELFSPQGLFAQASKAFDDGNWDSLRKISDLIVRRLDNKTFENDMSATPLSELKGYANAMQSYSRTRAKAIDELDKIMTGKNKDGSIIQSGKYAFKNSINELTRKANISNAKFAKAALEHPPGVWSNALLDEYTKEVMKSEEGAKVVDEAYKHLSEKDGYTESEVDKLRSDPRTILEIITLSAKGSDENAMLPNIDFGEAQKVKASAYNEIATMRARGDIPRYIPTVTPFDIREGEGLQPFNTFIGTDRIPTVDSAFEKAFDHNSSIYNLQAAILKETRQQFSRDHTINFIDNTVSKWTHSASDLFSIIRQQYKADFAEIANGPDRDSTVQALTERILDRDFNLQQFNPEKLFGTSSARFAGKSMYIDKDIAKALDKSITRFQLPATETIDKVTNIFRTSILGYSPRFTAHILFGGTFLLALRSSPDAVKFAADAYHMAKSGELPKGSAGSATDILQHSSTQEGLESTTWHTAAGFSAGQMVIADWIARKFNIDPKTAQLSHYLSVIPEINFRFTRFTTNFQRSLAYLDGAAAAAKDGHFYTDEYDEATKTTKRVKKTMTADQAHEIGMQHVESVMGDLRAMTPLERSVVIRVMPFWGWTKHILKYVLSYPMDHPYRATFLSQLAQQNSDDVATGLPLRIQLLFFLGKPDKYGNVNAVDDRVLNPLRDTANYASLSGWLGSLNPVITAPLSKIDPQITFGNNVLYPNITYNSLYGTTEAAPAGNDWNVAEQIVPQLSALDEAFNLSGQYSYLKSQGGSGFTHKLLESLNVPFLQEQTMNLRQMAAKSSNARYNQAKTAAENAWQSGDFSQLSGYGATVPDPNNPDYNISPAQLAAQYQETLRATGESPASVTPYLPSPSY